MKKLICLLLTLALLGSLWACGPAPVDGTQESEPPSSSTPPETDPPTESTGPSTEPPETEPQETDFVPPEGTLLTEDELAYYQQLFSYHFNGYEEGSLEWYNIVLFVEFDCPENVDWYMFFLNGTNRNAYAPLSDAEAAFVEAGGFPMDKDVRRLPAAEMDSIAMQYLGLTIAESNQVGLDGMLYYPDTDCYYAYGGGTILMDGFVIHSGAVLEDGTIRLYYNDDIYGERVITLKSRMSEGETGYYILSNLPRES